MAEVTFEIVEHIAVLSTQSNGWTKELNKVSWNNGKAKYDIRSWDSDHLKMSKGVTISEEEMEVLLEALGE